MDKELFIENSDLMFTIKGFADNIKESVDKTGHLILKGVPASVIDEVNGNGRKYTEKEIKKSIAKARKEGAFSSRKLLCSANDHPAESFVPPASASHVVLNAYTKKINEKNYLMNDWLVLNTSTGRNLKALIEAGASFGTSIRGLGQLNETTKEVENYDFLGCDAVGNPSAHTYASREQFEVSVESAPSTLVSQVREQLEGRDMPFDLKERIDAFKQKHYQEDSPPKQITQEVTADLLSIQREAVENSTDTTELDVVFNEVFGQPSQMSSKPPKNNGSFIDADVHNRTVRELEATRNLAAHLQDQARELEEIRDKSQQEVAAYEKVSGALEKVAVSLYEQLEEYAEGNENEKLHETKLLTRKMVSTITSLQKEAYTVIRGLETRLESAIRIGDVSMETAITLRRIADSLYSRQVKVLDESQGQFQHSRTQISKLGTKPELNEQEKKKHNVAFSERSGWA